MHLISRLSSERGYTFVELILAMAISGVMMVVLSGGVVKLFQIYQAGNEIRNTQQAMRTVIEEINRQARDSRAIAIENDGSTGTLNLRSVCVYQNIIKRGTGTAEVNTILTGKVFYTRHDAPAIDPADPDYPYHVTMYEADITTSFDGSEYPTNCAGSRTNARALTSAGQVSILQFAPTVVGNGSLLYYGLTIGGHARLVPVVPPRTADQDVLYPANSDDLTDPPRCQGGVGEQYCSITSTRTAITAQKGRN